MGVSDTFSNQEEPAKLADGIRAGILVAGALGTFSFVSTLVLFGILTYRMLNWRKPQYRSVPFNQCIVLVHSLLLADCQQAASFLIGFYWFRLKEIIPHTSLCFAQGWLIHIGDVSSGFFVFAIGLYTLYLVGFGRQLSHGAFCIVVVGIWGWALFLTMIGPAIHGTGFFAPAGAWCWIQPTLELDRLLLHYLWIFLIEFGVVLIYGGLLVHLYRRLSIYRQQTGSHSPSLPKVSKAARTMFLYPLAYVILTLPLATGRMVQYAGHTPPDSYYVAAGCLITSSGWIDTLLYTVTRRVLIRADRPHPPCQCVEMNRQPPTTSSSGTWSLTPVTILGEVARSRPTPATEKTSNDRSTLNGIEVRECQMEDNISNKSSKPVSADMSSKKNTWKGGSVSKEVDQLRTCQSCSHEQSSDRIQSYV